MNHCWALESTQKLEIQSLNSEKSEEREGNLLQVCRLCLGHSVADPQSTSEVCETKKAPTWHKESSEGKAYSMGKKTVGS